MDGRFFFFTNDLQGVLPSGPISCALLCFQIADSRTQQIPSPNPCTWHALGPVPLHSSSTLLHLVQNLGVQGAQHAAGSRPGSGWDPHLASGSCRQEGLVVELSSLGPHLPGHMVGHTQQQAAEQGSCSGFHLVSTHERASCKSCRGVCEVLCVTKVVCVTQYSKVYLRHCIHCKYCCLGVGRLRACWSCFPGRER